jgi:hypothetical protein
MKGVFCLSDLTLYNKKPRSSTVTLRVVEGDEREVSNLRQSNVVVNSKGLEPKKDCAGKGQQHIKKDRSVLSSERAPRKNETVTVKQ